MISYDASFSTMWANKKFRTLDDFFLAARQMGFARVELSHQINSAMLSGIELDHYQFSSIHEPCPADISTETLKARDWLISSPDEACRRQGVASIQRSIDLARVLGAGAVVVHCGMIQVDGSLESNLRALFEAGQVHSQGYLELKNRLADIRAAHTGVCLESVKKSLMELLEYAGRSGVRLGLENRYHAIRISDHLAPGLGEVDFDKVAAYLPEEAFRTCEFQTTNTTEQVKAGLKFLVNHGCIKCL